MRSEANPAAEKASEKVENKTGPSSERREITYRTKKDDALVDRTRRHM
jgi:hypothetical protein